MEKDVNRLRLAKEALESGSYDRETIEYIFPELKESEDERIRREIITYLSTAEDKEFIPYEAWIAWLEKQGEQKPVEWSEEDEQFLLVCKNALAKYQVSDKWDASIISRWLENRLKPLRPQSPTKTH